MQRMKRNCIIWPQKKEREREEKEEKKTKKEEREMVGAYIIIRVGKIEVKL